MTSQKSFLHECRLTERRLFQLVVVLTAVSLLSLLVTSALVFFDSQLSIWGLWYLGLFISASISIAIFLATMLACVTTWTRGEQLSS